ncbi:MAG: IPT/TIG domain-containing protein, partial [Myxococcales bacterium]
GELDDEHVSAPNQRCGCAYHRHLIGGTGGLLFVRLQDAPHRVHQIIDVTLGRGGPTHNNYRCNLIGPIAGYHFWHAERSWTVQRKQQHTAAQQLLFAGDVAIQNAVTNAFRITGVTPPRGPQAGGWPVTITGENIPQNVDVLFGGVNAANVVRLNATTVTATVPAGAALGAVHVRVQEQVTLIYSEIQNGFTYEAFALTSLCRCIGSDTGGESVVIVGTGFEHGATVTIPGAAPVATQVIAPNCIVIVSMPPHGQGNVNVNVTHPSGATQFYAYDYV